MNKAYIIAIIAAIVIIAGVGVSLSGTMTPETISDISSGESEGNEQKHYSVSLTESAEVNSP